MKKARKAWFLAAAVCIAVGLVLCTAAFVMVDGKIERLSTIPAYEQKTADYAADEVVSLTLLDRNTPVRLETSADSRIHITYYENRLDQYRLQVTAQGELCMEKVNNAKWTDRIGLNFNLQDITLVVALPEDFAGGVRLETTNGPVTASDLQIYGDAQFKTTNHRMELNGVECEGDLKAATTNGPLILNEVQARSAQCESTNHTVEASRLDIAGAFAMTTTNGGIHLDQITAGSLVAHSSNHTLQINRVTTAGSMEIKTTNGSIAIEQVLPGSALGLYSTNGSIHGTIADAMNQYGMESHTTNSTSNLPESMPGGPKTLSVKTTNGKIDLGFVG